MDRAPAAKQDRQLTPRPPAVSERNPDSGRRKRNEKNLALVRLAQHSATKQWVRAMEWLTVEEARASGYSWTEIGNELGITRQAAQQRYGAPRRARG